MLIRQPGGVGALNSTGNGRPRHPRPLRISRCIGRLAIAEAVMFANEQELPRIEIHSDSRWALNVIQGKWRPSAHKQLINRIRQLIRQGSTGVILSWIKAHKGHESNERADSLDNKGRQEPPNTQRRCPPPPPPRPRRKVSDTTHLQRRFRQHVPRQTHRPRTRWIKDETLQALEKARSAAAQSLPEAKKLRNLAKKMARRDRVHWTHQQLLQDLRAVRQQFGTR